MFCDLDKVDIVYTRADDAKIGVQTDHRFTEALAEDLPRTIVFTLARILRPKMASLELDEIECVYPAPPPERLREVIEVAGARLRVDDERVAPTYAPDEARMVELAAEALAVVGREALAREGMEPTEAGLIAFEQARAPDAAEFADWLPEQRYTALLELGAVAGEVIRAEHGGSWIHDTCFNHEIPFTVDREGARSNLFGRATRFYEDSVQEGPSVLVATVAEGPSDGPILPVLRSAGYGDKGLTSRPLVGTEGDDSLIPHIYLVQDRPQTVSFLPAQPLEDFDTLLEASYANLARLPIRPQRVRDDLPIYVIEGSFFATSKLLDRSMLSGLAETLQVELLLVAAPSREVALIGPFDQDPGFVEAFMDLVQSAHEDARPGARLSPCVFLADAQRGVHGLVRLVEDKAEPAAAPADAPAAEPEAPAPRPWWKRLFGK